MIISMPKNLQELVKVNRGMIMKKYKYLHQYVRNFLRNEGCSEHPQYLPLVVIYFREALDKLHIPDDEVPSIFGWDDETADDFFSWGHNSRWNHTFSCMLYANIDEYVDLLKKLMEKNNLEDFEVKLHLK